MLRTLRLAKNHYSHLSGMIDWNSIKSLPYLETRGYVMCLGQVSLGEVFLGFRLVKGLVKFCLVGPKSC